MYSVRRSHLCDHHDDKAILVDSFVMCALRAPTYGWTVDGHNPYFWFAVLQGKCVALLNYFFCVCVFYMVEFYIVNEFVFTVSSLIHFYNALILKYNIMRTNYCYYYYYIFYVLIITLMHTYRA